ncbi:YbaB/EbfC family nucleoid-associated protein [Nocardia sp. NPDC051052]|uniref:YbaB/EbfC family nucleoid-associated protein n=1 Tax=Nocardia sp. NPDC051052 TaxID=3364322 RepID=UPI0037BD44B2
MVTDFAALEAAARERLARMQQLSDDLAAVRVVHAHDSGAITITVDGAARLLDLRVSEGVSQLSPAEFERAVVSTAAAAAQQALGLRAALIEDFNGQVNE